MGSGSIKRPSYQKTLLVFIMISLMVFLSGSGTFQTQEAQVLVVPENPVPGSPLSVLLALPDPALPEPIPDSGNLAGLPSSSAAPAAFLADSLKPGDLVPFVQA